MSLFRRLSTFKKKKTEETQVNGNHTNGTHTNGTHTNGTNGNYANGNGMCNGGDGTKPNNAAPQRPISPIQESKPAHDNERTANRADVDSTFQQFGQLIHASRRPLPTQSGDGAYLDHEAPSGFLQDLKTLGFKDYKALTEVVKSKVSGELIDDKTYMMERVIQLVAGLPTHSKTRVDLTNGLIDELWNNLQHPPLSYLGDKYQYRQADGSHNNIMYPHLGAANTPYARSVISKTIQNGALPDPALVFDSVMARRKFTPHPNKVSSVFFYHASLIIHDLFQTSHEDMNISKTSSYLDLSPLYGDNQTDQDLIRTFKDGKLKPDCFAEERLLLFPPGTGVLLLMYNRFHNYVVEQLAAINERGRFTKPRDGLDPERAKAAWKKYDEDLFQVGRLVTCGLYINVTLMDYLRTIVNLNRTNSTWSLDPRVDMGKAFGKDGSPRGVGNQVSAEFNLAYRWHSAISERDEKWTENLQKELFGKTASEVSLAEFMGSLGKWEHDLPRDPHERPFGGLVRNAEGKFDDEALVKILTESIEDTAGAFGANNIPVCLKAIDVLGMEQSRKWNLGTFNEFRKFFGLKPHATFEDFNPDPHVADQLRHLYEHPDFVEMYPGIVSESAKTPMVPGVGIAPNFTISRAILSDAVALVRGDRFYTIDYTARNLTNWGYGEVQYDINIEQGCVISKLILRSFPDHFQPNSIYAHYPMTIPSENRKIMRSLGREDQYSWDRPARIPPRINLTSYKAAMFMLERGAEFNVTWGPATAHCMGKGGSDFMLSGDTPFHAKQKQTMGKALYRENWHKEIKAYYEHITLKLLHQYTAKIAGTNQVDITRDVGNIAHIHFASEMFSLPLKTEDNPHGIYSEHELYMILAVIFVAIFFDLDPVKSFALRQTAKAVTQQLGKLVELNVKSVSMTGFISGFVDKMRENNSALKDYGVHMVRKLLESELGVSEITWSQIVPTATAMVANQAEVFTQLLDYYLSEDGKTYLPDIRKLAMQNTPEADDKIMHYAMEGIRLNGTFGSYRESTVTTTIDDDGRSVPVKPGDKIFCSFVSANRDPKIFPNPNTVRTDRPLESYIHYGVGPHACLGRDASRVALTAMLKVIGKLKNLRRAPGPQGILKKTPRPGGFFVYMNESQSSHWPFPTTMKVHFDGELEPLRA